MLISTPVYNALGRIWKCALIEKNPYPVDTTLQTQVEFDPVKEIYKKNLGLIKLLVKKEISLIIFFNDSGNLIEQDFSYRNDGIAFISPVKIKMISNEYLQDLIHFVPDNKHNACTRIYDVKGKGGVNTVLNEDICAWLLTQDIIPPVLTDSTPKAFDGGNVQRGRHNGKDYLLIGSKEHCELDDQEIIREFNLDTTNGQQHFRCPVFKPDGSPCADFYHLDLYAAIAGKLKAKDLDTQIVSVEEVVLFARVWGDEADAYNEEIEKTIRQLKIEAGFLYTCVRLPVIRFPNVMYSYCNCIIENYQRLDGTPQVTFYFPDYAADLEAELDTATKNLSNSTIRKLYRNLQEIVEQFRAEEFTLTGGVDLFAKSFREQLDIDTFSGQKLVKITSYEMKELVPSIEEYIRKLLKTHFGIPCEDIHFIKNRFVSYAHNKAGLHCKVKVLERDRVNLDT